MFERRRQAASPVSLLVATLLLVWACSSGVREDASVATSGGAGSRLGLGGSTVASLSPSLAAGEGGALDLGGAASDEAAGSAGQAGAELTDSGSGGAPPSASIAGAPPADGPSGGTLNVPTSSSEAGLANSAGKTASAAGAAGAAVHSTPPPFVPPTCSPADTNNDPALFLPCEVKAALFSCSKCHGKPPTPAFLNTYLTFADIKPKAAVIAGMIRTGYMPRPPWVLSEQQKINALTWLGQDGTCAIGLPVECK